jgi:glycerate-2-kinase
LPGGDWTLLAAGTDGIDGPTPAAGAFCDGQTVERAGRSRARSALAGHDSHRFFAELGDLLTTGPTGTNVMDVVIALHPGTVAATSRPR